jgi:hypothetical protein
MYHIYAVDTTEHQSLYLAVLTTHAALVCIHAYCLTTNCCFCACYILLNSSTFVSNAYAKSM